MANPHVPDVWQVKKGTILNKKGTILNKNGTILNKKEILAL